MTDDPRILADCSEQSFIYLNYLAQKNGWTHIQEEIGEQFIHRRQRQDKTRRLEVPDA